jgi:TonB family protein
VGFNPFSPAAGVKLVFNRVNQAVRSRVAHQAALTGLMLALLTTAFAARMPAQNANKGRKVVVTVKPEYPQTLKIAQIGGLVRLSATVTPNGTVTKVEVRGGNPILAESASAAVMKWKYAPGPSETNEEISLSFSPH